MASTGLANQDWIKIVIMAGLGVYLCDKIYASIGKLQEMRIDFTETGMDADLLMFPSITFCPLSMLNWNKRTPKNITADYEELPKIQDMIDFVAHNFFSDNRRVKIKI